MLVNFNFGKTLHIFVRSYASPSIKDMNAFHSK